MNWLLYLFAIGAGSANPFQSGTNAELNKHLKEPVWTAVAVYFTGLAGMLLLQVFLREAWPGDKAGSAPWWAWLGGIVSIASTVAGLTLAQRLGSGVFTGVSVTAALATSIALDHFGLIGFKTHHASPLRLVGCGLMIAGLWMVAKF